MRNPFFHTILGAALCSGNLLHADTITFGGDDWTGSTYGRTFIGGGGDAGWTTFDDGSFNNSSRQQWTWMDVSGALAQIPADHTVTSAVLVYPGPDDQQSDGGLVNYAIFEVAGADRGRAAIIDAGPDGPGVRNGDDVLDYYSENTGYGETNGVTTDGSAPMTFDVSILVEGWNNGSLASNPGQMNLLWDSRGAARNYVRWNPSGADNGNGDASGRPTLTIMTVPSAPSIIIDRDTVNASGATNMATLGQLSAAGFVLGGNPTFAFVGGEGDADNASFAISGDALNFAADLAAGDYAVRIRVTDDDASDVETALSITVIANQAPSNLALSGNLITPAGAPPQAVGTVTAEDANFGFTPEDTHTFSLVPGAGSADNALFSIDEDTGAVSFTGNAAESATYSFRVGVGDSTGLSAEEAFTVRAPLLVGPMLGERGSATDGSALVFHPNNVAMEDGFVADGVAVYIQNAAAQQGAVFRMFLLRPTSILDEFDVVYDSGEVTIQHVTNGTVSAFDFPNGPVPVQAGDVFAHYGRGIPFSGDLLAPPIYWPSSSPPLQGAQLLLGPTGDPGFPFRDDLSRDYAWNVVLSGGLEGPKGLTIGHDDITGMITLRWRAELGRIYAIDTSSDLLSWPGDIDDSFIPPAEDAEYTFPAPAVPEYYRVRDNGPAP